MPAPDTATLTAYAPGGGSLADAAADLWDLCFLAVDPKRAATMDFTPPYIRIEGCYLLRPDAKAVSPAEVVARNLKIGVVEGSVILP